MSPLPNPHHEAFAQARFRGATLDDAFLAAGGYHSHNNGTAASTSLPRSPLKMSRLPDIKARLKELHNAAATAMAYERNDAIRDLVTIIKARPSEASKDHPLCEVRAGRQGEYHRFPSKLRAMARLMKIRGWGERPRKNTGGNGNGDDDDNSDANFDRMRFWMHKERTHDPSVDKAKDLKEPRDPDELDEPPEDPTGQLADEVADPATPLSPKQEAFAQARVRGNGVMRSYQLAGYFGHSAKCATRVNQRAAVQARIAQLRAMAEAAVPPEGECRYEKHEAINDLIAIVQASPSESGPENPLCEERRGSEGAYYRFPCKLQALALLARLMGWNAGDKTAEEPPVNGEQIDGWDQFLDNMQARYDREEAAEKEREAQRAKEEAKWDERTE